MMCLVMRPSMERVPWGRIVRRAQFSPFSNSPPQSMQTDMGISGTMEMVKKWEASLLPKPYGGRSCA